MDRPEWGRSGFIERMGVKQRWAKRTKRNIGPLSSKIPLFIIWVHDQSVDREMQMVLDLGRVWSDGCSMSRGRTR